MKFSSLCQSGFWGGVLALGGTAQTSMGASGGITVLPDVSVFVQIVNFIFLIWVLNLILYRPIRNILLQRKKTIEGIEQRIDGFHDDAKEKESTWISGIKSARAKGLKEKEALIQAAEEEERKIIDRINRKAQEDLAEVLEKIEKDVEDVRVSLQQEIDGFADAIGQKILGRAV